MVHSFIGSKDDHEIEGVELRTNLMDYRAWRVASVQEDLEETLARKGPWTLEEDMQLIKYISLHGEGRWSFLAKAAGLERSGKSCRLRWVNYLRPDLKRSKITHEEERLIIELHGRWGNRWSRIAQSLPGRTDNDIKNYWRTRITKNKNLQAKNCSSGMGTTDNRVHFEHSSTISCCPTALSERTFDLDSVEPSTSSPRQNTEEIAVQTNTNPYLLEDISSQEIPISEGNNENRFHEVHDPQISGAEQPEGSDNLFESSLAYNFSMGSLSTDLVSSDFFADRKIPLSSSHIEASLEAASDCESYLDYYWDALWNVDEEDRRFIRSQHSGVTGAQEQIKEQ